MLFSSKRAASPSSTRALRFPWNGAAMAVEPFTGDETLLRRPVERDPHLRLGEVAAILGCTTASSAEATVVSARSTSAFEAFPTVNWFFAIVQVNALIVQRLDSDDDRAAHLEPRVVGDLRRS